MIKQGRQERQSCHYKKLSKSTFLKNNIRYQLREGGENCGIKRDLKIKQYRTVADKPKEEGVGEIKIFKVF